MLPLILSLSVMSSESIDWVVYEGEQKNGKHIVFLAGDEEYRSEEGLPQMAKILAYRHGFKCTVLFSINAKGEIDPNEHHNQPGLKALDTADLVVMLLRFRDWPDKQMSHFDRYVQRGKPIIALRTSTHAFDIKSGLYEKYGWQSKTWVGGFGKQILGETWISHWGEHGQQSTRGVAVGEHTILTGVQGVFGTTDVYEAHPPSESQVIMVGEVVQGVNPQDTIAVGEKRNSLGNLQDINDPMMPIAWVRGNRLTCTMGAATDLLNEGLRRLVVNGTYWSLGMRVPDSADVRLVGDYRPSAFGFGGFRKGIKPSDLAHKN